MSRLLAFGGGPLHGHKLVRIAYLDEAGISDKEPFAVDRHWRALHDALSGLADLCAPPEKRNGFIFHATELFGGGKILVRGISPPEHGRGFLKTLACIPRDNGLPIELGWVEKRTLTGIFRPDTAKERAVLYHTMAFIGCVVGVERFMRENFPDEVCQLVVEDNTQSRTQIRDAYNFLKTVESVDTLPDDMTEMLPLRHIVDTVNFAAKTDSSPLQLADTCAFIIRRHLEKRPDAAEYYDLLCPAMLSRPKSDFEMEVAPA
jgi:hypothetical protein